MDESLRTAAVPVGPGLIGIPTQPWIWTRAALALALAVRNAPPETDLCMPGGAEGPSSIEANRNEIVVTLLSDPRKEWVLFIDSDMVPPPDICARLLAHGAERDIIAATCWCRQPPHLAAFALIAPDEPQFEGPLVEALWVGFGCVLVRRRVFEAMPFPWFQATVPGAGEDSSFCHKARALGFRAWVDTDSDVGHVAALNVTSSFALAYHDSPDGKRLLAARQAHLDREAATPSLPEQYRRQALRRQLDATANART